MRTTLFRLLIALSCAFGIHLPPDSSHASMAGAGFIKSISGQVLLVADNGTAIPAQPNMTVRPGDVITTSGNGKVGLIFQDDTVVSLGPNSEIVIEAFLFNPSEKQLSFIARLIKGTFTYISGTIGRLAPERVKLMTPEATLGVRGTQLLVEVK